jgi:hypothetical protein
VNGSRPIRVISWVVVGTAAVAAVLVAGLGLVAMIAPAASPEMWSRWSNAGQAFGVLTAVFSGFALAALVITFLMQLHELKAQRIELCQQRELLAQAQAALHRSSQADIRALHVDLIKLAIADPALAEVWPALQPGLDLDRNRQFLYANLAIQHTWLHLKVLEITEEEARNLLGYLFTSPLIREYWAATQSSRAGFLVAGTAEFGFTRMVDEVYREQMTRLGWRQPGTADQEAA